MRTVRAGGETESGTGPEIMPAGRKAVPGEVPRLPAPANWSAGSPPLTGALRLHTGRHQITLPFARPVLEWANGWLGFEPGAVFVQLLCEINRHGPDRWRLAVLRAGGPGERLCRVTGVRPGAELLLRVTGKGRTERALRMFAAIRRLGIDPVDLSPPWFAGAGVALNADIAPPPYSADQHAAYLAVKRVGG